MLTQRSPRLLCLQTSGNWVSTTNITELRVSDLRLEQNHGRARRERSLTVGSTEHPGAPHVASAFLLEKLKQRVDLGELTFIAVHCLGTLAVLAPIRANMANICHRLVRGVDHKSICEYLRSLHQYGDHQVMSSVCQRATPLLQRGD